MGKELKIGLIAGRGNLPFEVVTDIKARGQAAVVIGLKGECRSDLAGFADDYREFPVGQLGAMIEYLKREAVMELVFAGKVGKEALFGTEFDHVFRQLLNGLPQKNDDAILLALVKEFEKHGIIVAKQTDYLRHLLIPPGMVVGTAATEDELKDIRLGFRMAKAIGGLDIGQSVVVKNGAVLAVEAIEGTDQAIIRGGSLGGPGVVVVKVSKPEQDERFDVPTIGRTTIASMIQIKAGVLAIEAGKTLLTEMKEVIALASENQLKIISCQF